MPDNSNTDTDGTSPVSPSPSSSSPSASSGLSRLPPSPAEMWSGRALVLLYEAAILFVWLRTTKLDHAPWYGPVGAMVAGMIPPGAYVSIGKAAVTGLLERLPIGRSGK